MAEQFIIKDEYLPHTEGYCRKKFYHIDTLTRLLQNDQCEIQENIDKIKELLNVFQLNYGQLNQYK